MKHAKATRNNKLQPDFPMSPDTFAYQEYLDYMIYRELERTENNPQFKHFLKKIVEHEYDHYQFWLQFSSKKNFEISTSKIWLFKVIRKIFGLTFTTKYLENNERETVKDYKKFLQHTQGKTRERLKKIIEQEKYHEIYLIKHLKEGKVEFLGSIMLGFNDSMIEITGILVGFSFIFTNNLIIAISGLISGIAASLSMASSGYMQARSERRRDAVKSALYTGISYIFVVILLVMPFFFFHSTMFSLALMLFFVFGMIVAISCFTSILLDRSFKKEFATMCIFSLGVSAISFMIGSVFRILSGISI